MDGMKIGELAATADVGVETVRFYERRGLLEEPPRLASGYRMYDQEAVSRLQFIRRAKVLGFTLEEIRDLLALREDAASNRSEVRARARAKVDDVDQRIRDLLRIRAALDVLVAQCESAENEADGQGRGRGDQEPPGVELDRCPILAALEGAAQQEVGT